MSNPALKVFDFQIVPDEDRRVRIVLRATDGENVSTHVLNLSVDEARQFATDLRDAALQLKHREV